MTTDATTHTINRIELRGEVKDTPHLSHTVNGVRMFTFPLAVLRTSGNVDTLNIYITEQTLMGDQPIAQGDYVSITGSIRTRNNIPSEQNKARLVVYVQARTLEQASAGDDRNNAQLTGRICMPPKFRNTPLGSKVCDLILSVQGPRHTSYVPCIAWGSVAEWAAKQSVGTHIDVFGRMQSREYSKQLEDGTSEVRTAYEFSIAKAFLDAEQSA